MVLPRGCRLTWRTFLQISRAQVELEIRAMATKDTELQGKSCWRVLPDMVQKFGLSTPCPAQSEMPVAKAKKRKAAELQSAQGMPMNATQVFFFPQLMHVQLNASFGK